MLIKDKVADIWNNLSFALRIGFSIYLVIFLLLTAFIAVRKLAKPPEKREKEVAPLLTKEVTPTLKTDKEIPKEILIDSVDTAALADMLETDTSTSVTRKQDISDDRMVSIATGWLQVQLQPLKYRIDSLSKKIDKDREYILKNEPLLEPTRKEQKEVEEAYKKANAALDLPLTPNSSFSEEIETRYTQTKNKLAEIKKQLKNLEESLASAKSRLDVNESLIAQLQVEESNMREKLDRVRQKDQKILPIIYQYASSGLTSLPLLKFVGKAKWNVEYISEISYAFERSFSKKLPVTAFGQSDTHTRLGWDHSNAADVGVHPESEEGKWLTSFLTSRDIPFMAFRRAVPGVSTGAHFHIGMPSHRLKH